MLLQSVDLAASHFNELDESQFEKVLAGIAHLNILTPVKVTIDDSVLTSNEPTIVNRLKSVIRIHSFSLGCRIYNETETIKLFDSGVSTVFVDQATITAASQSIEATINLQESLSSLPRNRLGLHLCSNDNLSVIVSKWREYFAHFTIEFLDAAAWLTSEAEVLALLKLAGPNIEIYACFTDSAIAPNEAVKILNRSEHLHVVLPPRLRSERLTSSNVHLALLAPPPAPFTDTVASPGEVIPDILDFFIATLKSDRIDGLFTTVVCDPRRVCLGLVYSNASSLTAAFLDQQGVYWSRSRNSLWRKGESSGMRQHLLEIRLDCDRDAIQMRVVQGGHPPAFCHLLRYSCWESESGLTHLEHTLQDRLRQAPPGSYTKRLFEDSTLLRNKLLEEAQELAEAETKEDIASEAADVLYFAMVKCVAAQVSLQDVEEYLDLRAKKVTRRPGNAKDWRIAAAAQILAETATSSSSLPPPPSVAGAEK